SLFLQIGSFLSLAPQTAILESIVCRQYYEDIRLRPLVIDDCKIEPIQSKVAFINGWKDVFETLPVIVFAVPFGALADKIGRKKVLLLAIFGIILSDGWVRLIYSFPDVFPPRAVWLGGWWQAIGAGGATLTSIIFAQVADVCPPEKRTTVFSLMTAIDLAIQIVFIPVGAGLMEINPWIPMFTTLALDAVGLVLGRLLLPETLRTGPPNATAEQENTQNEDRGSKSDRDIRSQLRAFIAATSELGSWISGNMRVVLVMGSMFCFSLAMTSDGKLLLQYVSKRLGWTIGKASVLLSFKAGVSLLATVIVLPVASNLLIQRMGMSEARLDRVISQTNGAFLVFGSTIIALATSWVPLIFGQIFFSLGSTFLVAGRSVVTNMVEPKHRGLAFTVLSILSPIQSPSSPPLHQILVESLFALQLILVRLVRIQHQW
ncbi:major facilitator superfamily domain-containing protein, partial [Podospora australis]